MLDFPVKASEITNLTDARYFAAWGVQWMGFCLDTSAPNYLNTTELHAIKEWVEGPEIVLEVGLLPVEEIQHLFKEFQADWVQVNMLTDELSLQKLINIPLIKEIIVEASANKSQLEAILKRESPYVKLFILDFDKNNIDWTTPEWLDFLEIVCKKYSILLTAPSEAEKAESLSAAIQPKGFVVKGGEEEKVGFKSYDDLDVLFESLI